MAFNFAGQYHGGRPKRDILTGSKDCYALFMERNPGVKLTYVQYNQCIIDLNAHYVDHILKTGHMVTLPHGLGKLCVKTNGDKRGVAFRKGMGVNWKESMAQGNLVYWTNHHTEGRRYNFKWIKSMSKIKHKAIWRLDMMKANRKLLSEHILSDNEPYRELYKQLYIPFAKRKK